VARLRLLRKEIEAEVDAAGRGAHRERCAYGTGGVYNQQRKAYEYDVCELRASHTGEHSYVPENKPRDNWLALERAATYLWAYFFNGPKPTFLASARQGLFSAAGGRGKWSAPLPPFDPNHLRPDMPGKWWEIHGMLSDLLHELLEKAAARPEPPRH